MQVSGVKKVKKSANKSNEMIGTIKRQIDKTKRKKKNKTWVVIKQKKKVKTKVKEKVSLVEPRLS